ncbi:MAG: MoxR family ATPase [Microthrixaceae bacterium]|nr:MoxR family ATPase [Microthrixaceae bacterium]
MAPTESAQPWDPTTPDDVRAALDGVGYLADDTLATAILLALRMRRPLFLEGEPGTGKTEVAKALVAVRGGDLIRLQCHEGIDAAQALAEWDHPRQLLGLRAAETAGSLAGDRPDAEALEANLYDERYLIRRPLLAALAPAAVPPVLLIDEIDRADDEFEAFLLEILSDWAVTIPELGTIRAEVPPVVVLTSNRTRDVHDALKRRCLYHWLDHPDPEREVAIIARRVPGVGESLARQVAEQTARLRTMRLTKPPGVAESIDWATALVSLGATRLEPDTLNATLGAVLKYHEDHQRVTSMGPDQLLDGP